MAALLALPLGELQTGTVGRERVLIQAWVVSREVAREAVLQLRDDGWIATEGPPTPAHGRNWETTTAPARFADNAIVCFPWSPAPRHDVDIVVEIDPAGGFGAGAHPSTLMMLQELAIRGSTGRVLDVGCGSGVLSIAAALLGADKIEAIDIAEASVNSTAANAELNHVADRVTSSATPLAAVTGRFDIVLANIHAPVLIDMAADFRRRLKAGGWLGLAGISPAQTSVVAAAMHPLRVVGQRADDGWAALVLQ
jgi:ribosomal protein L11 methyltransferase